MPDYKCKECTLRQNAKWRVDNNYKTKNSSLKYFKRKGPKDRAVKTVAREVRAGRIVRSCCAINNEMCRGPIDAHHWSYEKSKWKDVQWLCRAHHTAWHRLFIADGVSSLP